MTAKLKKQKKLNAANDVSVEVQKICNYAVASL